MPVFGTCRETLLLAALKIFPMGWLRLSDQGCLSGQASQFPSRMRTLAASVLRSLENLS